jgi:signal transduction histidine kinase
MVFFLSWTVQGLLHSLTPNALSERHPAATLLLASSDLVQAALLAVVCYTLAAAVLERRLTWPRVTVAIVAAATVLALARLLYLGALHRLFGAPFSAHMLMMGVPGEFLVTAGFLGLGFTIAYSGGSQARELAVSRLESELAQARLQALQAQLHPHFLFNAFNSISALMHRDVEAADRMLARLGELLRRVLRRSGAPFVTLHEELEFVQLYLEIEQARFGERLQVSVDVEPGAREAVVPHLLLQPLVENAVRHGIAQTVAGGRVEIAARVEDGATLALEVRDTGRGLPPGWTPDAVGVGLSNVRSRLEQVYRGAHSLQVDGFPGGGVRVRLRLPLVPAGHPGPSVDGEGGNGVPDDAGPWSRESA